METPHRSSAAPTTAGGVESSFFFDPNSLLAGNGFDDGYGSGLTPQQAQRSSGLDFWSDDASLNKKGGCLPSSSSGFFCGNNVSMFDEATPQRATTAAGSSARCGVATFSASHADGGEYEDDVLSPAPFSGRGVPSVAGLSSQGGTTASRSATRSMYHYTEESGNSVSRYSSAAATLAYGFGSDMMMVAHQHSHHSDNNGRHDDDNEESPNAQCPSASMAMAVRRPASSSVGGCQLLLDNSMSDDDEGDAARREGASNNGGDDHNDDDGEEERGSNASDVSMECPIDIDALVKLTPSDAKKHEHVFKGIPMSNKGRLNMNEMMGGDGNANTNNNTMAMMMQQQHQQQHFMAGGGHAISLNMNGNAKMSRTVPLSSLIGADGKVGDSPAKLTASELRRLTRQQQQMGCGGGGGGGVGSVGGPMIGGPSPAAVVADTVNGRRMPTSVMATARVAGGAANVTTARPTSAVAVAASVIGGSALLPGNAVEVLQPSSRRVAPPGVLSAAAVGSATRPSSSTTATSAPSPCAMSGSHRSNANARAPSTASRADSTTHDDSCDSVAVSSLSTASGRPMPLPSISSATTTTATSSGAGYAAAPLPIHSGGGLVTAVLEFKMGRRVRCRCPANIAAKVRQTMDAGGGAVYLVMQSDHNTMMDAGICSGFFTAAEKAQIPRALGLMDQGTVLRIASDEDCDMINNILPDLEERAMNECFQLIHFLHLPFQCVDVEATFDQSAIKVFYRITSTPSMRSASSNVPNVSRLQRELAHKLRLKVTFELCPPPATTSTSTAAAVSGGCGDAVAPAEESAAAAAATTVTMRASHSHMMMGPVTAGLSNNSGNGVIQTSTRRLPPSFVMSQQATAAPPTATAVATTGASSAFTVVGSRPPAPSVAATASNSRQPSTMSFAVSASTPGSMAVQPSPSSFVCSSAADTTRGANHHAFVSEPTSSFVVTAPPCASNGGRAAPLHGHGRYGSSGASAMSSPFAMGSCPTASSGTPVSMGGGTAAGRNTGAMPWVPCPQTPTARSSCTSPRPECISPTAAAMASSNSAHMPVASSRRTVPTAYITNVQATGDNITYNGTSYSSTTPVPHHHHHHHHHHAAGASSRPSSSVIYSGANSYAAPASPPHCHSAVTTTHMMNGRGSGMHSHHQHLPIGRSATHTPCNDAGAASRTPSVVSLVSPSEASSTAADDYAPVASSRRRVFPAAR